MLCWLESPMLTGGKYVFRYTSSERAMIKEVATR